MIFAKVTTQNIVKGFQIQSYAFNSQKEILRIKVNEETSIDFNPHNFVEIEIIFGISRITFIVKDGKIFIK